MPPTSSTIAAIATAPGEGGLAVLRISGPDALGVARAVFHSKHPRETFEERRMIFGSLETGAGPADRAMAVYFKGPKSYTGEDTVELSVHGGGSAPKKALERVIGAGALPAAPGEFTRRAFLNGKLDLVQAEAVAQLIRADTDRAHRVALRQINGELSERLLKIKAGLRDCLALVESNIDFSHEDIALFDSPGMILRLEPLRQALRALLDGYRQGRVMSLGARVALVGPPNAGKSSLLNALCEKERVLVDARPGTTRDTVEETIALEGQRITLVDTAGIRRSRQRVEARGIALSRAAARSADLVLLIFDAGKRIDAAALRGFESLTQAPKIYVLNKGDLKSRKAVLKDRPVVTVSARKRRGLSVLKDALLAGLSTGPSDGSDPLISTERQRDALSRAAEKIDASLSLLRNGSGEEILAVELRGALNALAALTGEVTAEDVLNRIFGSFCIGK